MKTLLLALAFGLIGSGSALAVKTAECPEYFSIEYKKFVPSTDAQIEYDANGGWTGRMKEERDALAKEWASSVRVNFKLKETQSGKCDYATNFDTAMFDSRLYSKNGRDILRLDLQVGEVGVWIHHNVAEYGQDRLLVQNVEKVNVYGGCQTGGCQDKIGTLILE